MIYADGDGKFSSAFAIAQVLLQKAGGDREKALALGSDRAEITQFESLMQ